MALSLNGQNFNDPSLQLYNGNDPNKVDDGGKAKGGKEVPKTGKEMMAELLKEYEKAKVDIREHMVLVSAQARQQGLSDPQDALKNNPIWQAAMNPQSADVKVDKKDIKNLFQIIFAAMDKNNQSSNADLAASAAHILANLKMTTEITQNGEVALAKMKDDIHKAYEEAHNPLNEFLKIFIPIVLVVISIVLTVATLGAAAPEAAIADGAGIAAVEGGLEGGVAGGVGAGASGGVSAAAGTSMEMVDMAAIGAEGGAAAGTSTASTASSSILSTVATRVASMTATQVVKALLVVAGSAVGGWYAGKAPGDHADSESAADAASATVLLQGNTSASAAAINSIQNSISGDQSSAQNETKNLESVLQAKQTVIAQMLKVYNIGNV